MSDESVVDEVMSDAETPGDDRAATMEEQADAAALTEFNSGVDEPGLPAGSATPDLEAVMNIPVTVSMEIGRTQISIRNLLQLNQGSVVELDRLAGEPLDVLVNGTLIAHGEVVVVNEKFGIRLTDVISAQERVKKLR
ncbi:MAG: flagellar motor switch protein FliN [Gammaproteobacteria bacterium]|nr:flagellar motor switch protein FliN [Gammaproteobacteria bacterium]|tara:strand:- start:210 stop:623 length:414 start_codon:yes stop_codon:yes gene_type:complete